MHQFAGQPSSDQSGQQNSNHLLPLRLRSDSAVATRRRLRHFAGRPSGLRCNGLIQKLMRARHGTERARDSTSFVPSDHRST
jgi:hypothetical protein